MLDPGPPGAGEGVGWPRHKAPDGPALIFAPPAWRSFLEHTKRH
ncbi:DUF397 domain-containing protein [Micromonospora radicis]|uniref:DUF397 domain-containing protein n=1 Tax=Micromonospora radicis TaxID=1894971 RepID=A0A418MY34_9ACTN|nr:DUF397 domain-containing protein [Micromonospora radicis]